MISQMDKFREGPLAETEIQMPPSSHEDKVLSRLNQNYRLSKAQQILRLLRDQDDLNKRFHDCALLDEEGGGGQGPGGSHDDCDNWSVQEEQESDDEEDEGSDTSENEAERRAARRVALRKHRNSVDPGRCKTSMGFHNRAEVTEVPYDTDSDNVAGMDSACSTPRGVSSGALSARQPANHQQGLFGSPKVTRGSGNSRMRVYHLKIGEDDAHARDAEIPEECVVQSARSSRPKTSLTSMSSSRNRYYRQQPHPESHYKPAKQSPAQKSPGYQSRKHGQPQSQSVGDTRQAIISRLNPHHPMAVRPFCGSQEDVCRTGPQQSSSQLSTPRGGVPVLHHTEVTLFDMAPTFSRDTPPSPRRAGLQGAGLSRTPSFRDHQRVTPVNRALLSVDSSPMPLGSLSPRPRNASEDPSTPRRLRSTRVKKRVGEMPRGMVPTSVHPTMTVIKLPALESSGSKSGCGRDLLCVGKD
ncbi:hypothetical protein ACOMHN_058247 [Nucella lapillus]